MVNAQNIIENWKNPTDEEVKAAVEKRHWRGVKLFFKDEIFNALYSYNARNHLKEMGFTYDIKLKTWTTDNVEIAAKLIGIVNFDMTAKDALRNHMRFLASDSTLARASKRLPSSAIQAAKENLTAERMILIREAISKLVSFDEDKATQCNNRGFSKAHSELGHTLDILGIKTYTQAALALTLIWTYRKQINAIRHGLADEAMGEVKQGELT